MAGNSKKSSRSADTIADYASRFSGFQERCLRETGAADPTSLASWLVRGKDRRKAVTWRTYKSAAIAGFEGKIASEAPDAADCHEAIAFLQGIPQTGCARSSKETSATKAERFRPKDQTKIFRALACSSSKHAPALRQFLDAGLIAGLRPCEWWRAHLAPPEAGYVAKLIVLNAKRTNGRAHGETRTLRWTNLTPEKIAALEAVTAQAASFPSRKAYKAYIDVLGDVLHDIERAVFPRRSSHITISTCRHEFAAMAKVIFRPEEVAALMGHAVDETAHVHYGRTKGRGAPHPAALFMPTPDPAEVARVRRTLEDGLHEARAIAARRAASHDASATKIAELDIEDVSVSNAPAIHDDAHPSQPSTASFVQEPALAPQMVDGSEKLMSNPPASSPQSGGAAPDHIDLQADLRMLADDDFPVPKPPKNSAEQVRRAALESARLREKTEESLAPVIETLEKFLRHAKAVGAGDRLQSDDPTRGEVVNSDEEFPRT